jgi:serine phosphatase RsbU (regulator of sigma subunit)/ligand-binding sensor domain-containing protein
MLRLKGLLLTIFTIFCLKGVAQNYYPPVVNYSTHNYGKDRNPENYCAVQDKRGVMYFGNANGLLEFDGESWNFITIVPGAYVYSLNVDTAGVIYVGTYGDLGYLKPNDKGELKYVSLSSKLPEEDQFFSEIWDIHTTNNKVYYQSYEAFFEYDIESEEIKAVYPSDEFSSFHTSFLIEGELYLRSREIGLVKYDGDKITELAGTEFVEGLGVFGLHRLVDDSLLIVTQEIGLWKWKDGAARKLPELNDTPLNELGIFGSTELTDGNYALNSFTSGVLVINSSGKIKKEINREGGLRSNSVRSVFEDRDQNLWFALGNGISKVNYHSPVSFYSEIAGIEGNIESMIRFKDKLYVGTSYGLFVQDTDENREREFKNTQLVKDQVWDFVIVDDHLFIATSKGIFKTSGTTFTSVSTNRSNIIKYIPHKDVFVSAGPSGIYVYSKSFALLWQKESNFSSFLSATLDPNQENTMWLGSANSGVFRLQLTDEGFVLDQYGYFDGLNDNELGKPIVFNGEVIFGSTQGLLKFIHEDIMTKDLADSLKNDPDYNRGMFQTEALYDSTFTEQILLIEDDENRTWYCSEDKLGFYDKKKKRFIDRPFWGVDYGRVNEFYLEDNGVLWIGCADGLIRYEKNIHKVYEANFNALIRRFSVGRDSVVFDGAFSKGGIVGVQQSKERILEIDYEHNDVYFSFAAPYFEDGHLPVFSYMLEGNSNEWSPWKKTSEANFTNLKEGEYCFKVRARNVYGTMSRVAEYRFKVLPPWYRTTFAYILYVILFIIVFIIGMRISSARLKKKNIWLEGIVEERTKEITEKNEVLKEQKQEIEDSINYAQRIQEAILPLEAEMKKWMPKSFVLFRPKDIVSGDFYWFTEKNNKLVFICADCTGHGVPGAFMSMIGSDRLNIIVGERQVTNPGLILSELNRAIKKSLKQDGEKDSSKDGMDAAICTIDLDKNVLMYAGANRPLWYFEDDEIKEIKATKVAVAGFTPDDQVFEEHVIPLSAGLKFYMTSDGYADQFGGDRGKKLKVKAMKQLIADICNLDHEIQRATLDKKLVDWMGDHEQIDDVCVVGFET